MTLMHVLILCFALITELVPENHCISTYLGDERESEDGADIAVRHLAQRRWRLHSRDQFVSWKGRQDSMT